MSCIGQTYYVDGEPVVVLVAARRRGPGPLAPFNVQIRRADGRLEVRPFRGLRREKPQVRPPQVTFCTLAPPPPDPGPADSLGPCSPPPATRTAHGVVTAPP